MRRLQASTAVLETLDEKHPLLKDEIEGLRRYFNSDVEFVLYRLTFLLAPVETDQEVLDQKPEVLATAIVVNYKCNDTWTSYLFSAIVTIPFLSVQDDKGNVSRMGLFNSYIHAFKTFSSEITFDNGEVYKYKIRGNYFAQQNRVTSVCAHAALCMTFNNLNTGNDKLLLPEHINKALNIDHKKTTLVNQFKFNVETIQNFLRKAGFSVITSPFKDLGDNFAYRYIEGRCPSLLVFSAEKDEDTRHIVPVVGHTINYDLWTPEAERAYTSKIKNEEEKYTGASNWVDNYIIHDDNYGMYCNFPSERLRSIVGSYPIRPLLSLSIVPEFVTVAGEDAEVVNLGFLQYLLGREEFDDSKFWNDRLKESVLAETPRTPFVVRTFLVKKADYVNSLDRRNFCDEQLNKKEIKMIASVLPDNFWLTEISLPDLYTTNQSKLVDLTFRADLDIEESDLEDGFIYARFPGVMFTPDGEDIVSSEISTQSHTPVFSHPGEMKPLVW